MSDPAVLLHFESDSLTVSVPRYGFLLATRSPYKAPLLELVCDIEVDAIEGNHAVVLVVDACLHHESTSW